MPWLKRRRTLLLSIGALTAAVLLANTRDEMKHGIYATLSHEKHFNMVLEYG